MVRPTRAFRKLHLGLATWLLAVSLLAMGSVALVHPSKANAENQCDPVNIIQCGLDPHGLQPAIDTFKFDYDKNCDNHHCDLKQVYRWAGATDASVANMNTDNTKMGTILRSGDIMVGGKKVGVDAKVAARFTDGNGFTQISPGVWARKTTVSFAEASAPVIVHFSSGNADFAVMINCGNAVQFNQPPAPPKPPTPPTPPPTPPQPQLVCDNLNAKQVGDSLRFNFHAHATANHTTISKYIFDFGDSQSVTSTSSDASHVYSQSQEGNTLQARVTVYSKDFPNGKTSADCTARVPQPPTPSLVCRSLVRDGTSDPLTYDFTATAAAVRTTITNYSFIYSDGHTVNIPTSKLFATDKHSFTQHESRYAISVNIEGTTADGKPITAKTCSVTFTTPSAGQCKPGVPIGSAECAQQPCPYNAQLGIDDASCIAPTKALVDTGPGAVVLAAAGVGAAGGVARFVFLRRRFGL